ncbi:Dual specificity protein kinase TTK [Colletotrichum chlorophyti]|uniref:Dual specificity protein kinase TTK n=1 Tax=Colletotrichum chlorophyti TaxID=708187 RepID=A0A1Q8RPF4_9PEZI|nr:Dual specificity protein kinase TTK [Colletotrichum chlorophyti]
MAQKQRPNFDEQFQTALSEFDEVRQRESRTSADGREFILVENVTKRLKNRSPTCPEEYENDLDRLGQTAYLRHNSEPPRMRKQHYEDCLAVFYTLLDIRNPELIDRFRNKGLNTLPIGISELREKISPPPGVEDFHRRFCQQQFAWCPIRFKLNIHGDYRNCVSPFCGKDKITPYRHGKGPRENTASLYAINVPEELVDHELRITMSSARIERQGTESAECSNKGYTYRFALKQFKRHKYEQFDNEMRIFERLDQQEGMIRYIGWFQSTELVEEYGKQVEQEYFNIVLELAEFDLYEAIQKESPPISFDEIQGFWDSMSDISKTLADIHTVIVDGHKFLTWHGDIKPENILRIDDKFKLADPGEARMKLKTPGTSGLPHLKFVGGTRTYAAPEKTAYLDNRSKTESRITPESDVWSLGCVFSIAATYVVLGKQGFLIYDQLRRQAFYNATESMSDVFHNGESVLPEVLHWHKYLREAARKTDVFSAPVLDMVDDHMLVAGEKRWKAKRVFEEFQKILKPIQVSASCVPPELHDMLQSIDLEVERTYDHNSGIRKIDSGDDAGRLKNIQLLSPSDVEFESRKKLLDEGIQPTAQRSRKTPTLQTQQPYLSFAPTTASETENESRPQRHGNENYSGGGSQMSPIGYDIRITPFPVPAICPEVSANESIQREPVTIWAVKGMLEKMGLTYQPSLTSLSSLFSRQPTAVKGKSLQESDLAHLDERLKEQFRDRDLLFLVDNGSTMWKHWTQATELLEVLVWRALGYDDNGMELCFTNPDTNPRAPVRESRKQTVRQFTKAMRLAGPAREGPSACQTTIIPELERIINEYTRAKLSKTKSRNKTIIVLTDGIWQGMHDEYTLDLYFRSAFHNLRDLHGDFNENDTIKSADHRDISETRPVTIQFVQFGNDSKATERLRRLDDDLTIYGCPDLIDTELAEGDIYKMFLGSLCRDIDSSRRFCLPPVSRPSSMQYPVGGYGYIDSLSTQQQNQAQSLIETTASSPLSPQMAPYGSRLTSYSNPHQPRFTPSTPHHELSAVPQNDTQGNVSPLSLKRSLTLDTTSSSASESAFRLESGRSPWPAPLAPHQSGSQEHGNSLSNSSPQHR